MSKPIPISTPRTLEDAAHFHDIQQRAKLARPVEQGRDILESTPVDCSLFDPTRYRKD